MRAWGRVGLDNLSARLGPRQHPGRTRDSPPKPIPVPNEAIGHQGKPLSADLPRMPCQSLAS